MGLLGFWSYVHADDEVDMGRVTQLAYDIVGHYGAITTDAIEVFLDRDDLKWGDPWEGKIDEALSNVAFFIPVITPKYFKSAQCRRELQQFASRAEALHIRQIILPILYIDVPELHQERPSDPLVQLVQEIQWRPWLKFRFKDRESGEYREAVHNLATELVERVASSERTDVAAAAESAEAALTSPDNEAGTLDRIAALEEAIPRWNETLLHIGAEMERIGEIMQRGAGDIRSGDNQGKGFAARLAVARRVASQLGGPVAEIEKHGQAFASDLAEIDAGIRILLEQGAQEIRDGADEKSLRNYCDFVDTLRVVAENTRDGIGAAEGMIASSEPLEKMSRDMRAPLRRMRNSLTAMLEARDITASWVHLADSLGIDCAGRSPAQS